MPKFDPMLIVLALGFLGIGLTFWRAHNSARYTFDAFDLIMEGGRVSKTAVAFMLVLGVSTWVIIDLQIRGTLTEGFFTIYTGAWIIPLVARVVFNKAEMPGTTTVASMVTTTTVQEPAP